MYSAVVTWLGKGRTERGYWCCWNKSKLSMPVLLSRIPGLYSMRSCCGRRLCFWVRIRTVCWVRNKSSSSSVSVHSRRNAVTDNSPVSAHMNGKSNGRFPIFGCPNRMLSRVFFYRPDALPDVKEFLFYVKKPNTACSLKSFPGRFKNLNKSYRSGTRTQFSWIGTEWYQSMLRDLKYTLSLKSLMRSVSPA